MTVTSSARPRASSASAGDAMVDVEPQPVVLVRIVAPLEHEVARRGERGDVVDVAVGVVVERQPVREPDGAFGAELGAQLFVDLDLRHRRIPVRVHQALRRGDEGAVAVAGDRPTLEHHVDRTGRVTGPLGEGRRDARVGVERVELLAPRVEHPVGGDTLAGVVEHVDRPGVAEPRVVDRHLDDLDARAAHRRCPFAEARRGQHRDRLVPGDRVGDVGVRPLGGFELVTPQLGARRPAHHRSLVRFPLRRQSGHPPFPPHPEV